MTPEREFILTVFSYHLDQNPSKAKEQAMDMCIKYLEQQEKADGLEEHTQLLEEKIDELTIDYQILRMELEIEQQKNLSNDGNTKRHIELPNFLSSASLLHNFNRRGAS